MANIATRLFTARQGRKVGEDNYGNVYFEQRVVRAGARQRRWVVFAGAAEASKVPPEWHCWLTHTVDAPLTDSPHYAWQKPHLPNLTGTAQSYRPKGHDYRGGERAAATGDYEAWAPDA
jgi:NADH:ubiquinone oxidoreductase subunit